TCARPVVPPVIRLDPAPLERESVRVEAHRAEPGQVLFVALPVAACRAGAVAVPNLPGNLLPIPPVVPVVPALHLMGGGGRAPEERRGVRWNRHAPPGSRNGVPGRAPAPRSACGSPGSRSSPSPGP